MYQMYTGLKHYIIQYSGTVSATIEVMRKTPLVTMMIIFNLFASLAFGASSAAGLKKFEKCLNNTDSSVQGCVSEQFKNLSIKQCYQVSEKLKIGFQKERVQDYCFYEISDFPNLKSCTESAKKFITADNRDAALFNCVQQFQPTISVAQCKEVAKSMTFHEKKTYLQKNCESL